MENGGGAKWTKPCKKQINTVHLKPPRLNGGVSAEGGRPSASVCWNRPGDLEWSWGSVQSHITQTHTNVCTPAQAHIVTTSASVCPQLRLHFSFSHHFYLSARCPHTFLHSFLTLSLQMISLTLPCPPPHLDFISSHQSYVHIQSHWSSVVRPSNCFFFLVSLFCFLNVYLDIHLLSGFLSAIFFCFFIQPLRSTCSLTNLHSGPIVCFLRMTHIHWIIDGIIMFLPSPIGILIDKVFGYKRLLRFKDTAPHVSRDFASLKSFPLILSEKTLFSRSLFATEADSPWSWAWPP